VKRLFALAAVTCAGVLGAACDISPPAATVGKTTITRSQLDAQLSQVSTNSYAQCALELQGISLPSPLTGSGDDTVSSTFASFELSTMVLGRLVDGDLAARHQSVIPADIDAARADFAAELTPSSQSSSPCGLSGPALVARLPRAFVDQQVRFLAGQERLAVAVGHVDISDAALRAYYQSHASQFQEICLSDIAVTDQAKAQQIHDAIANGSASFATEAQQASIDTSSAPNGGQLGCVASSVVVNSVILQAIAGLAPGQLSKPTFEPPTNGSMGVWFILRLDGRPLVPFDQAAPQIRQQILSGENALVSAEFTHITRHADVVIDPRYGSWSSTQGVRPPLTPKPADLLAPPSAAASPLGLGSTSG